MKILVLGDIMGLSGRDVLKRKLPKIIKDNKIDFSIINGENAADDGRGITQEIAEDFITKLENANYKETQTYFINFLQGQEVQNLHLKTQKLCK